MNLRILSVVLCVVNILISPLYFVFLYSAPELPTFNLERTAVSIGLLMVFLVLIPAVNLKFKFGLFVGALFGMALTQTEEGEIFPILMPTLTVGYLFCSSFLPAYENVILKLYTCMVFALFWLFTFTVLSIAILLYVHSALGADVQTEFIKIAFREAFDMNGLIASNVILLPSTLSVLVMYLYKKHLTRSCSGSSLRSSH
ncbi:hypothetical protein [Neptuniibacter sp. QD37_11]|uniref:hypothetical protein n=1 Tax=Neptuniibacter sp. QD37_11 TaxID=3398209 RepID=UPI0039F63AAB